MSLSVKHLTYTHTDKEVLFRDVNLSLEDRQKIALVGNNGSGKSTLMQIIAGNLPSEPGEIIYPAGGVFYVPQHFGQYNNYTLAQAMQIGANLQALQAILAGEASEENFAILNDRWNIEEEALESLAEWGLGGFSLSQPLQTLSGGEKTKVFLAGMKIHEHAILLLDEPTNHLDYRCRERLYDFVKSTRNGMIIVSHDRTLLNLLPETAQLSQTGIRVYGGNYEFYKEQKELEQAAILQKLDEKEKQLRLARKTAREVAERQQKHSVRGEKQNQKKGVSRIAMGNLKSASELTASKLKNIHSEKTDSLGQELRNIRGQIPASTTLQTDFNSSSLHVGKILFRGMNIQFAYNEISLWARPLDIEIRSGDRICIEGDNGSGKTTLLRIITGDLQPIDGTIDRVDNLSYVYLDQEYSIIKNNLSVLEQADGFNPGLMPEHEIKTILNRFLFPAAVWDKPCSKLSGGEKMRLAFCCLMIANNTPDMFILDEPTNNLDLTSINIITDTIRRYKGTVIVVSHDKYFLEEAGINYKLQLEKYKS